MRRWKVIITVTITIVRHPVRQKIITNSDQVPNQNQSQPNQRSEEKSTKRRGKGSGARLRTLCGMLKPGLCAHTVAFPTTELHNQFVEKKISIRRLKVEGFNF